MCIDFPVAKIGKHHAYTWRLPDDQANAMQTHGVCLLFRRKKSQGFSNFPEFPPPTPPRLAREPKSDDESCGLCISDFSGFPESAIRNLASCALLFGNFVIEGFCHKKVSS